MRSLQHQALLLSANLRIAKSSSSVPHCSGKYDLKKLGLTHLKKKMRNAHLTCEAAHRDTLAAAGTTAASLTATMAILDSGASKHFFDKCFR